MRKTQCANIRTTMISHALLRVTAAVAALSALPALFAADKVGPWEVPNSDAEAGPARVTEAPNAKGRLRTWQHCFFT